MDKSFFDRNLDSNEDFQFKPLTEGLGFNKKKAVVQDDFHSVQHDYDTQIFEPLTKKTQTPNAIPNYNPGQLDDVLKELQQKRQMDFLERSQVVAEEEPQIIADQVSIFAILLDTMLVASMILLCLIALISITHVDLVGNFKSGSRPIYFSFASMVASLTWIYLVATRVFVGFTPGEWVFDQQLGRKQDSLLYTSQVMMRSLIAIATGFVIFPLISTVFGKDILGKVTGIELIKKLD